MDNNIGELQQKEQFSLSFRSVPHKSLLCDFRTRLQYGAFLSFLELLDVVSMNCCIFKELCERLFRYSFEGTKITAFGFGAKILTRFLAIPFQSVSGH